MQRYQMFGDKNKILFISYKATYKVICSILRLFYKVKAIFRSDSRSLVLNSELSVIFWSLVIAFSLSIASSNSGTLESSWFSA